MHITKQKKKKSKSEKVIYCLIPKMWHSGKLIPWRK